MPTHLHIDIETYSSEDIKKCGVYKYAASPDFEILLIAYSFGGEIKIIDLAQGEKMPAEFKNALLDPEVLKFAHNANFERVCFKAIGYDIPASQWRCSMVKAAYCGLPLKLEDLSKIMNLGDNGKLSTGAALIRYFCLPCKPTKSNGMRFRNFPKHDLEKWNDFKTYCANDVAAEMAVLENLKRYAIPDFEQENYTLDQKINDAGIEVDVNFAATAYKIDTLFAEELKKQMVKITGVENPNSPAQLKKWLGEQLQTEVTTLAKDSLKDLIKEVGQGAVSDLLALRQKASKTSVKKYTTMLSAAMDNNRVYGMLQFYGANRTGRWAGRLIQMQNLPQNKIKELDFARNLFTEGDYDTITMIYDDIPSILSQLIRTAFVAPEYYTFAVADFSAIEARVIAWLAGEKWRNDVFATHGKIYEASASMMFNIPLAKITKELRAKGKVAELALGYQGSVGALIAMGGEKMGLSEIEMKDIVSKWREKSPAIVQLWKDIEDAAKNTIKTRRKTTIKQKGLIFECNGEVMAIKLPSGRRLFYQSPGLTTNRFGQESIKYKGMDQTTKQWGWVDSYGGKFTENIVQAISRDLLAHALISLDKEGYRIVMHVHDEAIAEVPVKNSEYSLKKMCEVMSITPTWAEGLNLPAEGYLTKYYKKD